MRKKFRIAILACSVSVCLLQAQSRVGQPAPVVQLNTVLQGELPKNGHALVMEVWASYCLPCVADIPHLNTLADQFKGRNIDFVWLGEESVDEIRAFLQKHPMHGTVAADAGYLLGKAFDVRGLPTTILIGVDGRIAAVTRPDFVNASVLEALAAGIPLPLPPTELDARIIEHTLFSGRKPNDADAVSRVVVKRADQRGVTLGNGTGDTYETPGANLRELLADAYGVSPYLVEMPGYLNQPYAVEAWVPDRYPEAMRPLMQASLCAAASIRVRRVKRTQSILVLSGLPAHLQPVPAENLLEGGSSHPGEVRWKTATAESIRSSIEIAAGQPVMLDKPVAGKFAFTLHWNPGDTNGLEQALGAQGITLERQGRTVDALVVESLDSIANPTSTFR